MPYIGAVIRGDRDIFCMSDELNDCSLGVVVVSMFTYAVPRIGDTGHACSHVTIIGLSFFVSRVLDEL
jgi:hypothetical protein